MLLVFSSKIITVGGEGSLDSSLIFFRRCGMNSSYLFLLHLIYKKLSNMRSLLFLGAMVLLTGTLQAQKYGHMNFGNLIAELPATKAADEEIQSLRKEMVSEGEKMAKSFQDQYTEFLTEAQSGAMSRVEQEKRTASLQQEEQKIVAYEQKMAKNLQNRRQELLAPIVEKVEAAIKSVAEENGYEMIFDTSVFNAVLFAEDTEDVMELVKAKLEL